MSPAPGVNALAAPLLQALVRDAVRLRIAEVLCVVVCSSSPLL